MFVIVLRSCMSIFGTEAGLLEDRKIFVKSFDTQLGLLVLVVDIIMLVDIIM